MLISYQARYDLSSALTLRAPTLVFLFVLLMLEGLRFQLRHMFVSGGLALAGWTFLAGYAVLDTGPVGVTRDYKEFLTESKILIGAVVEVGLAIALTTAAIAMAVHRGRTLLAGVIRSNAKISEALDRQQILSRTLETEVAERKKANAALEQLVNADPLTGLPNARAFRRLAAIAASEAEQGEIEGFTILRLDLDGFRLFNDGFGYAAGDAALVGAAEMLAKHAPDDAKIARIGADEFALLTISAISNTAARELSERLSRAFANAFPGRPIGSSAQGSPSAPPPTKRATKADASPPIRTWP